MRKIGAYLIKLKEQEKKTIRFADMQDLVDSSPDDDFIHAIKKRIPRKLRKRTIVANLVWGN